MRKIISAIYLLSFFSLINSLSAQVTFTASSPTAECDDASFCVEISVTNFDSVTSFQYVYDWDTTIMQLTSFTDLMPAGIGTDPTTLPDSINAGRAPYSWVDLSFPITGLNLANGTVIAELCFAPNNLGSTMVDFDGNTTTIQTVSGVVNGIPTPDIPAAYVAGTATVQDTENPVITCPANQSISSNGTMVMGIAPTSSSDNCGIASITYNMVMGGVNVGSGNDDASNEFFNVGTTTVTYTITDNAGNTDDCSFDVTLTAPPPGAGALQFIPEINYDCDAGTVSIDMLVTNFDSITGMQFGIQWDTSSITFLNATSLLPPATSFNSASDSALLFLWFPFSGNPLTLTDSTAIFTLDFTLNGTLTLPVLQYVSFTGIPIGVGQVQNGTDVPLSQDVDFFFMPEIINIIDNTGPMITNCPTNISVSAAAGTCAANVTWIAPTITDNCGIDSTTVSGMPGMFPVGIDTITYTVTDIGGNVETCSFTVTVTDDEDPSITCPSNVTANVIAGTCGNNAISLGTPTTSDNCGVATVTNDAPATYPVGSTTVTWTVTDVNGNTETCTQTVTITDNEDPTITCPANITQCPGGTITLGTPTTSDNCGVASVTNNAPASFPLGMTTVTWTVTDDNGNTETCTQTVTIEDTELPTITCPLTDAIDAAAGECDAVYTSSLTPAVNDNCDNDLTVTYAITGATTDTGNNDATNETFNVGTSTLTYYVMDDAGNIDSCSVTVQVNDNENPTLTCPSSQSIFVPTGTIDTMITGIGLVSSSDNCGLASTTFGYSGALNGPGTGNDASGTAFPVGSTNVTYYVTDIYGNVDSCSFNISVQVVANNLIGCPPNQIQPNDTDSCNAVVNGIEPILFVPSGDITSITWSTTGASTLSGNADASGQIFNVGTTTVEYIATDNFGTMDTCSFDVTVFDSQNPSWTNCPSTINVSSDPSLCSAIVSWTVPTASDNCGVNQTVASHNPGDTFLIGTTAVSYVAIDAAGNVATCSFNVIVEDNSPPTTTDCPMDISIASNLANCEAIANWTPPTFTDCITPVSVTCSHEPGDTFPVGTTTVICIAVDALGNDTTCSFDITVQDSGAPTVNCPADITVNSLAKDCGAFVNWPLPSATDDCDNSVSITQSPPPGTFFPVGTTTVTVSATDDAGNVGTCMFDVIVNDVIAPVFECPTEAIVISIDGTIISDDLDLINTSGANANCDSLSIIYNIPSVTDNCNVMSTVLNSGIASGGAFPLGTTVITYTATDDAGNFTNCTFEIEVLPLDPVGVAIQPSDNVCEGIDIQLITNVGSPGATFSWSGPNGFMSDMQNPPRADVTLADAGFYSVTVTYASGCTATGTEELTVNEADPITASSNSPICIDGNIELSVTGPIDADYTWTGPDNFMSNDQNPVITDPTNANSGVYSVSVEYDNGCVANSSTNVVFTALATPEIDLDCDTDICLGSSCLLTGTEYSPIPDFYNWTATPMAGSGLPANTNDNQISILPTAPGTYIYNYSVEIDGCESVLASQVVIVHGAPNANDDSFDITYENAQEVFVTQNDSFNTNIGINVNIVTQTTNGTVELTGDGRFTYTPNAGFIGVDQFIYEICYDCGPLLCDNALVTLTVSDNGDCELPTVITPNQDGLNDELFINCLETGNFPNNEIIIYNQWGDEVFTAAPYQNNWKGTHDDKDLPDGTYYVVFRLDDNAEIIKQYITIFR